jgi:hypothetical protein
MLKGHLLKYAIFALIGFLIYLSYSVFNLFSNSKAKRLVKRAKKDSRFARKLSDSLEMLYYKNELGEQFFENIMSLTDGIILDNHEILFIQKINIDNYLLIIKTRDQDFNLTITGKMGDVERIIPFSYRLFIDRNSNQLKLYSDFYYDRVDKGIREHFGWLLFKYLLD